jgi:hypothetical protein
MSGIVGIWGYKMNRIIGSTRIFNNIDIFGLSFNDNGEVEYQFRVVEEYEDKAKIVFYSWITGCENRSEIVRKDWIDSRCKIYTSHKDWIEAADYYGDRIVSEFKANR